MQDTHFSKTCHCGSGEAPLVRTNHREFCPSCMDKTQSTPLLMALWGKMSRRLIARPRVPAISRRVA